MVKIGSSEIIISETVLLVTGQRALIEKTVEGIKYSFELVFESVADEKDRGVTWKLEENGIVKMTFRGWGNSLGTVIKEPIKLGDVGGKTLAFQVAQALIGDVSIVHFQVMLGGAA